MKTPVFLLTLALALPAAAGEAPPETVGLTFGGGFSGDLIHESHTSSWLSNAEASAWAEADLGTLIGADHWYLRVNPSLVWGAEESWEWRLRLYQAWLSWDGSDSFNAQIGRMDPGWFFHSLPSAGAFVRLPSRAAGEFSPGALGLLDLYPISAPAFRMEWKPAAHFQLQAAAFRLDDGTEIRGRALAENASGLDRILTLTEIGWRNEGTENDGWRHRFAGLGGWWLPAGGGSWGLYAFADAKLWSESDESWQGLSGFVSASTARAGGFKREERFSTGLSRAGLIPGRDEDTTSLAFILEPASKPGTGRHAWEVLHRFRLKEHWWLQGTLQRQRGQVRDWRLGLRLGCDF
jgi:hypothetical protein